MQTHLIIDASNILYRNFFGFIKESEDINIGMCHSAALHSMSKYYYKYKAHNIVMAFDDYSWRKVYTNDLSNCITHKKYKGTRRQNLTQSEKDRLARFDEHVDEFFKIMRDHTGIVVLRKKYLEADDLIAGYMAQYPDDNHILISSDKDFLQLVNDNIILIDPQTDKPRSLEEWLNDPKYYIFEKCFRGDTSDNVMNAYPRLQTKKIKLAFTDDFLFNNLMANKFKQTVLNESGEYEEREYTTRDVFEENQYLMDLTKQPPKIKQLIIDTVSTAVTFRNKFNYVKFLRFCGKYELQAVSKNIDKFVPLLSGKNIK